jgi:glycosyltransferase involved in cell wall biosynthesis
MALPSVSVCFPAYNEEAAIADVLEEAHHLLSTSGLEYEIVVCDDGSADRTAAIIESLAPRIPKLRILKHVRNLGISATFEHLFSSAAKEFVFLNATDRQWRTSLLFELLPLTSHWDIIVASRTDKHYGSVRRFVSWGFNAVPMAVFGVKTFDAGAVKLVRREIIERFPLVSRSPFSEAERLIRATRAGYRVTEYPVEVSTRRTGRASGVRVSFVVGALLDVPRVWWALRRDEGARRAAAPAESRR